MMSIYKELNEVVIDLSEFEVSPLPNYEKKRVQKIVKKKLKLVKSHKGAGVAAAVLAIGLLAVNHQTIANMPFVAALLEDWGATEQVDWSPYKSVIGETSTTAMGKLTLNEVIVNYDKIMISATFEKNEDTTFSYQYQLIPTVIVNGKALEIESRSAQSIEQNSTMYTIYNEVTLTEPIVESNFDLQLIYNEMLTPHQKTNEGDVLEQPWTFDVTASQLAVQNETTEHDVQQKIVLENGEQFVIDRIVTTPISTTIYYSGYSSDRSPNIILFDASGKRYLWNTGYGNDDGSGEIHYTGASFVESELFIQVLADFTDDEVLSEKVKILN